MSSSALAGSLLLAAVCLLGLGLNLDLGAAWVQTAPENHPLGKIEKHLMGTVLSHDIGQNIASLADYAAELRKTLNPSKLVSKRGQLEIVANLTKASEFAESPKCDFQEFQVLNSLGVILCGEVLFGGQACSELRQPRLPRSSVLLNKILRNQSDRCWDRHIGNALDADARAPEDARRVADQLLDAFLKVYYERLTVRTVVAILRRTSLSGPRDLEAVREFMRRLLDQSTLNIIREGAKGAVKMVADLLEEHLLSGCRRYAEATGEAAQASSLQLVLFHDRNYIDEKTRWHRIISASNLCKVALGQRDEMARHLARSL